MIFYIALESHSRKIHYWYFGRRAKVQMAAKNEKTAWLSFSSPPIPRYAETFITYVFGFLN
jgi:hypothetical protein